MSPMFERAEPGTVWVEKETSHLVAIVGPCHMAGTDRPGLLYRRLNNPDAIQPVGPYAIDRHTFMDGRFVPHQIQESNHEND